MSSKPRKSRTLKNLGSELMRLLNELDRVEFQDVEIDAEELEIILQSITSKTQVSPSTFPKLQLEKPQSIINSPFLPDKGEYPGKVREVTLGATKKNGGSRGKTVTIGGAIAPSLCSFEASLPHSPIVALDVFDIPLSLPKAIRTHVEDVIENPPEWAKMAVEKFGADVVTIHLLSTDPLIKDASAREAAETVEDILQAVDVPIIVGGCGDPKKDTEVFKKVSESAEGEKVLLSSVTLDMDEAGVLSEVATTAAKHNHLLLGFTALDLNRAKELNRKLYQYTSEDAILMDLTTAALGYGLEYSFTIHERARMAALMGDTELQHPTLSGTTNAWAAREAWLNMGPEWEPRSIRGPLWETVTALTLLLAGVDLFMMMHPTAIKTLKDVINRFSEGLMVDPSIINNWITNC